MKVARDFTCPRCHATPGEACRAARYPSNGYLKPGRTRASHKERIALAAAANQAGAR